MPQQIVRPEIGDVLWYFPNGGKRPMPMIVSFVHSERSVTGMAVDEMGWSVALQRIYMKHMPDEHPDPPYCCWPERKSHT